MNRRTLITLLGGAAAWPLSARAQQRERLRRIGVLLPTTADDPVFQDRVGAFLQGLERSGWTIGRIAALTGEARLPAVSVYRQFAIDGGLIGYGPDTPDIFRRSAAYVDRILKGAKPSELPVQAPVKFELVINLKTAKALGIEVPPMLLARADEVIE